MLALYKVIVSCCLSILLKPLFTYRLSCNTESFTVEGASIEHELIPIVTSDVNVYGRFMYIIYIKHEHLKLPFHF